MSALLSVIVGYVGAFTLIVPEPVPRDTWLALAAQADLEDAIAVNDQGVDITCQGTHCVIDTPTSITDPDNESLLARSRVTESWIVYDIWCEGGIPPSVLTLLCRVAEGAHGYLDDLQTGDIYPEKPDEDRINAEAASATAFLADLPAGPRLVKKVATIVLVVTILLLVAVCVRVAVAEHTAGGRFSSGENRLAGIVVGAACVLAVVVYFVYAWLADRYDAQIREAGRDWMNSQEQRPIGVPVVFIPAFIQQSRLRFACAFALIVVGVLMLLAGVGLIVVTLTGYAALWLLGIVALIAGVGAIWESIRLERSHDVYPLPKWKAPGSAPR